MLEVREIRKCYYNDAIDFAIEGMHLYHYVKNRLLLKLYGMCYFFDELNKATVALGAYENGRFKGVLLAAIKGERRVKCSILRSLFVAIFYPILSLFFEKKGATAYYNANKEMLAEYLKSNKPDGELLFLAADPFEKTKGVGSALLEELSRRENGKLIYLYTDDGCSYGFYDKKGFSRLGDKTIIDVVELRCFLYSKRLII